MTMVLIIKPRYIDGGQINFHICHLALLVGGQTEITRLWSKENYKELKVFYYEIVGAQHLSLHAHGKSK